MATSPLQSGSLYWVATAVTDNVIATPIKAAGTTLGANCDGFSADGDNRLTFRGQAGRKVFVNCSFSVSCSGATQSIIHLYMNDRLIPGASIERKIGTSGDIGAGAVSALVKMKKDDYVELWCETDASADDMTVERATLTAMVVG